MRCKILSCTHEVFSGEAEGLYARGSEGWFGVLAGHAPASFALQDAPLRLVLKDGQRTFHVRQGVVEVRRGETVVLADEVTEVA
mgnify:CR=1 FL=1|jgi:F-type H+-transporting ATPase subunit epsilon